MQQCIGNVPIGRSPLGSRKWLAMMIVTWPWMKPPQRIKQLKPTMFNAEIRVFQVVFAVFCYANIFVSQNPVDMIMLCCIDLLWVLERSINIKHNICSSITKPLLLSYAQCILLTCILSDFQAWELHCCGFPWAFLKLHIKSPHPCLARVLECWIARIPANRVLLLALQKGNVVQTKRWHVGKKICKRKHQAFVKWSGAGWL